MAVRLWGLAYACLIPLLAVAVLALWIGRQHTPQPFQLFEAVLLLIDWSIWAALAPVIVGLAWWVPLNSGRWIRGLSTHLIVAGLVALGEMAVFIAAAKAVGGYPQATFAAAYWRMLSLWYPYALIVYWVIAIAAHAVAESRRARAREVEAAQLREQLVAAQLDALRMQLHPHFLCNTLNTVAVFLRDGQVAQAEEIVTGLGALLHTALDRMDAQEVTLREELRFVGQYLEIERIRFSDRMRVTVETENEPLDGLVPCMILQPVVENAIRHGISKDPHAGRVAIRATRHNGRLDLAVQDDGPGIGTATSAGGHGVGLYNARLRLDRLYGDAAGLRVREAPGGGAIVEISLPFHTRALAPDSADGPRT
jgi:signal transduction histidine kinase